MAHVSSDETNPAALAEPNGTVVCISDFQCSPQPLVVALLPRDILTSLCSQQDTELSKAQKKKQKKKAAAERKKAEGDDPADESTPLLPVKSSSTSFLFC